MFIQSLRSLQLVNCDGRDSLVGDHHDHSRPKIIYSRAPCTPKITTYNASYHQSHKRSQLMCTHTSKCAEHYLEEFICTTESSSKGHGPNYNEQQTCSLQKSHEHTAASKTVTTKRYGKPATFNITKHAMQRRVSSNYIPSDHSNSANNRDYPR